jgi:hypothetical protein
MLNYHLMQKKKIHRPYLPRMKPQPAQQRRKRMRTKIKLLPIALAAMTGFGCLFASERASLRDPGSLVSEASARVGRPLTPGSVAGVARRTTRRGVYGAAAVGVGVGTVGLATHCVRVVGANGQMVTRCN